MRCRQAASALTTVLGALFINLIILKPIILKSDQPQSDERTTHMNWLFKEEPTHYSYDELVRDGKTSWTGVKNPLAQRHLRSVQKSDRIFYYHTGDVKAVVGIAKAPARPTRIRQTRPASSTPSTSCQ